VEVDQRAVRASVEAWTRTGSPPVRRHSRSRPGRQSVLPAAGADLVSRCSRAVPHSHPMRGWLPQLGVAGMWRFTAATST
jgi:hypothetical protein